MLLPIPAVNARAASLERHLALVKMRSGHGNADVMSCLLKTVYMTYFLHEAQYGRSAFEPFRDAERVLTQSVRSAELKDGWSLPDNDCAIIETILTLHDRQLDSVPAHLLATAQERLNRFISSDRISPIPPDIAVDAATP